MEAILSWVKSGLLFSIFASVILMLSPNKTYMKYISLIIGLLFVLVMIHPIMEGWNLDSKIYVAYIENLLRLDGTQESMTKEHRELYEDSVAMQLVATLRDGGYDVGEIVVKVKDDGSVEEIHITFAGAVKGLEYIENYVKNLFGEEVRIYYETGRE